MKVADRVTSRDGTSIAFDRIGSGPAFILVDAAAGFRGFGPMVPLAEAVAPNFTAITYDRRGRGQSTDTLPYAVDREVEDLEALIEAAGGFAFVHGFSSGAVLALHAAAKGLSIRKMTLLEPPVLLPGEPPDLELEKELSKLVADGRRGDAVEHFNRSIGVPDEYLVGMRDAPYWPTLEALAHTLVYDSIITRSLDIEKLSTGTTPTVVIDSGASDNRFGTWADALIANLANAERRTLPGEWHGVSTEVLAPALTEIFLGR
jgi:pimeloyl-ACP methyl ester carboxylesterase